MEMLLLEIINELRCSGSLDDKLLAKIIHKHNRNLDNNRRHYAKKKLLPYYLRIKELDPERWSGWDIDEALEKQLFKSLQVKPRRTASGVATITVITKPWCCSSDCLYCPNDLRMPKSYLHDEPACQRAERNYFDPYLQVTSRLRALTHMGHVTDKIELIILGGTWSDYPEEYQLWFVSELFRALNDGDREEQSQIRRTYYKGQGLANRDEELEAFVAPLQKQVDMGSCSYNVAIKQLYYYDSIWKDIAFQEVADTTELNRLQNDNETAEHRVVGLVVETRPDTISCESLKLLRQLGCTKIQMGIQSINPEILAKNNRNISLERIQQAFELVRVFGFKIHTHTMLNLFGSTPEEDKREYARFVTEEAFQPDEIKLYPCALVQGTRLCKHFEDGSWEPYTEEELLDVLIADTLNTPAFVRISRMIRDISAEDIVTGNKKANLRQLVERRIEETGGQIAEIRQREISTGVVDFERLSLSSIAYKTTVTDEFFLQWTTPENRIAGFLRLSLPYEEYLLQYRADIPLGLSEAMIREVHVYGKVAKLQNVGEGAQHLGLGKLLIEEACTLARARGYQKINVISSVGTREYYRSLGFSDTELYQQKTLV